MRITGIEKDYVVAVDGAWRCYTINKKYFSWKPQIFDEIEVFEKNGEYMVSKIEKVIPQRPHREGDMTIEEWLKITLNH